MFHIRNDGEELKQGFNFYPWKSTSIGFILKIKNTSYMVRWSRVIKKFFFHKSIWTKERQKALDDFLKVKNGRNKS